MKHVQTLVAVLLAFAVAGCGGSGGGSSTTDRGLATTPQIEAVLANPSLDPAFPYQDPQNLQTNETVIFQLVNYTTSGSGDPVRHVLSAANWFTSDTINIYGTISPDTGLFQTKNQETLSDQTVGVFFNGVRYETPFAVKPRQLRLKGRILNEATLNPIANIVVEFYGDAGNGVQQIIGRVKTASDGSFRASVPDSNSAGSISIQVRNDSLPNSYYRSFVYKGITADAARFQAGNDACRAVIPDFSAGDRTLVDTTNEDPFTNGTILITPKTLYPALDSNPLLPDDSLISDGCNVP